MEVNVMALLHAAAQDPGSLWLGTPPAQLPSQSLWRLLSQWEREGGKGSLDILSAFI